MNWRSILSSVCLTLMAALTFTPGTARAGAGIGYSTYSTGGTRTIPTYYANSVSIPGSATPETMRKFVDTLPGVPGFTTFGANNLGQYIPAGVPEKWVNGNGVTTNDDYYEIAVVEYQEKLHSDLPKATTLRGYVQLETAGLYAANKSKHFALKYPDGTPILDAKGNQIYAVDQPHYLGPMIVTTRGTAVRVKFTNLLPKGRFDATTGKRNGDLFLPVDETLMGAGLGPDGTHKYTQNGSEIHLHGGDNPWISDGTPHQWVVPAGENTPWPKGASQQNVPDMPDPGPGSATYYFPNGESARLMFYHDHTLGFTRLNVYAGEAAGYLIQDAAGHGENLLPLAGVPQIPLIIQEKTFVPADIAVQDTKWDTLHWGQPGDLWFPHVYETNQDPTSYDGTNPVGRWDWGPWFWPVFPADQPLPTGVYGDVTTTPEAFGDTPLINGTPYPAVTVDPKAYRFRILNATNDRMINLSLFVADPTVTTADGRTNTEVKMIPSAPGALPACASTAPVNPVTGIPNNCLPATWPVDGRDGGVPDPTTAGPKMIQIGTEGGLLPQAAIIPANPTNYEYMRRSITVLNVSDHALLLGSAERADVVVDFSQYAGKTLILYNDAPAPIPAFDARIDYYTGDVDQTDSGGWFTTAPGFGPNTRTIMQIKVTGTAGANGTPFDEKALLTALPQAFADSQPKPVVAESAFNTALGTSYTDKYARIFTGSATQHTFDFVAGDTISYYPEGSTTLTTVGAGQVASIPVLNKAIQELFDTHGRMNATLGVEIPYTGSNVQTTVPLGYIDPATETITDGETQIWKITHNGVDTHPVHFHLVNVQVINRVGWDGTVKPPNPNEVGWKETVRMNPLEDIIVAVRAKKPTLGGFGIPNSVRYLAPAQAPGDTMGFMNLDPTTGNPYPAGQGVSNTVADFGWEYVWHCHILGHEENDFMRPFIFRVTETIPAAPANLTAAAPAYNSVNLSWTDNSANEIGFVIERATGTSTSYSQVATTLANATSYVDTTVIANTTYQYRIHGFNSAGNSGYATASVTTPDYPPPTSVSLTTSTPSPQQIGSSITLNAAAQGGSGVYQYQFRISAAGSTVTQAVTGYTSTSSYNWNTTGLPGGIYTLAVYARNASSTAVYQVAKWTNYTLLSSSSVTGVTLTTSPSSPQLKGTSVQLSASASGGSGNYEYQFLVSAVGGTVVSPVTSYGSNSTYTWNTSNLTPGTYTLAVYARNVGSTAMYEAAKWITFTVTYPPVSSVSFSVSPVSPQNIGTSILLSASATGASGNYEYQFRVSAVGSTVTQAVGPYSTTNTYTWNTSTLTPGTYTLAVYARNVGSTAVYEAAKWINFTVTSPPVSSVSFTTNPLSPQSAGTSILLSGQATGGTGNYEYQFRISTAGSTVAQAVGPYSTANTYTWNTTGATPGIYTLAVYARNAGSTATYEAAKWINYTLK
ncbi:multicopper oxidase domain-containing protein [Geomonas sp. Red32]|uniref:multicopper oxidase domain-containing protein n=1 Tax=Geomonas sp. Red32 TaxID=2912856 RepID=UPI00202CD581|nr:multicopper oxidase domain-containing protein [Geomonas sp. Red32]MCM0083591.1 multicopper oxidase domain-containing protein [Geomonas sp. Red32]